MKRNYVALLLAGVMTTSMVGSMGVTAHAEDIGTGEAVVTETETESQVEDVAVDETLVEPIVEEPVVEPVAEEVVTPEVTEDVVPVEEANVTVVDANGTVLSESQPMAEAPERIEHNVTITLSVSEGDTIMQGTDPWSLVTSVTCDEGCEVDMSNLLVSVINADDSDGGNFEKPGFVTLCVNYSHEVNNFVHDGRNYVNLYVQPKIEEVTEYATLDISPDYVEGMTVEKGTPITDYIKGANKMVDGTPLPAEGLVITGDLNTTGKQEIIVLYEYTEMVDNKKVTYKTFGEAALTFNVVEDIQDWTPIGPSIQKEIALIKMADSFKDGMTVEKGTDMSTMVTGVYTEDGKTLPIENLKITGDTNTTGNQAITFSYEYKDGNTLYTGSFTSNVNVVTDIVDWTPIDPSQPVDPEEPDTDIPWTDLEPSTPVEPGTDIPWIDLKPSIPVENPDDGTDIPWTDLTPSTPVEDNNGGATTDDGKGNTVTDDGKGDTLTPVVGEAENTPTPVTTTTDDGKGDTLTPVVGEAENTPTPVTTTVAEENKAPKTGDASGVAGVVTAMIGALGAAGFGIFRKRK